MLDPKQAREDARAAREEAEEDAGYAVDGSPYYAGHHFLMMRLATYADGYARMDDGIKRIAGMVSKEAERYYENGSVIGARDLFLIHSELTALLAEGQPDEGGAR